MVVKRGKISRRIWGSESEEATSRRPSEQQRQSSPRQRARPHRIVCISGGHPPPPRTLLGSKLTACHHHPTPPSPIHPSTLNPLYPPKLSTSPCGPMATATAVPSSVLPPPNVSALASLQRRTVCVQGVVRGRDEKLGVHCRRSAVDK